MKEGESMYIEILHLPKAKTPSEYIFLYLGAENYPFGTIFASKISQNKIFTY